MAAETEVGDGLVLREDGCGLTLVGDGMELRGDFVQLLPRLRPGILQRELLVKAAKLKGVAAPVAVDATAGLGEDALLLAAAGFSVTLCEHDPVIAALLRDTVRRAVRDVRLCEVARRMRVVEADSIDVLVGLAEPPDLVYLDPMFPERRRRAATNKKLQLFQHLERPCANEEALMQAALAARPCKIVVKRPLKGPHLAGVKPSSSFAGKVVRYDVIVPPAR